MDKEDLRHRIVTSSAWFASTRVWMQAASWVTTIVLARLLTPEDYGLFAMALAVIGFLELFQEFGLGTAIIQRQDLRKDQINAIFWAVAGTSLVIAMLASAVSGTAAWYYKEPRLVWIIRFLSVIFLINSLGTVPYSLLTKEIDFKKRSLSEAYGVVVSIGISVFMAYTGYGVWALVVGHLARAAIKNLAMAVYCHWIPSLDISYVGFRDILRFSLHVAGASIVTKSNSFTTPFIIGRMLGGNALGIYGMAESLGTNPFHKISTQVINQLSLPVFSKLQRDTSELRSYFLKITKYLCVVAFPMQIGMALVAGDLVTVLLSDRWISCVELVQVFSVGGILYILPLPSSPLLTARGRADINFRYSWVFAVGMTLAVFIGANFGLRGVAVGWLMAFPLLRAFLLHLSLREIALSWKEYLNPIAPAALSTVIMAIVVIGTQSIVSGPLLRLLASVAAGCVAYFLSILIFDRKMSIEVSALVREMVASRRVAER